MTGLLVALGVWRGRIAMRWLRRGDREHKRDRRASHPTHGIVYMLAERETEKARLKRGRWGGEVWNKRGEDGSWSIVLHDSVSQSPNINNGGRTQEPRCPRRRTFSTARFRRPSSRPPAVQRWEAGLGPACDVARKGSCLCVTMLVLIVVIIMVARTRQTSFVWYSNGRAVD
jgi:hypothetical protein